MDRNPNAVVHVGMIAWSLSARRAWIEIEAPTKQAGKHAVALRKESVDRNASTLLVYLALIRRSPQGERG